MNKPIGSQATVLGQANSNRVLVNSEDRSGVRKNVQILGLNASRKLQCVLEKIVKFCLFVLVCCLSNPLLGEVYGQEKL